MIAAQIPATFLLRPVATGAGEKRCPTGQNRGPLGPPLFSPAKGAALVHRAAVACAEPSHLRHQNSAQIGKPSDQRRWRPERWPARLVTGRVKALALWDRPTCVA